MVKKISTDELKKRLADNENFLLIDVLSPESFAAKHIPKSISIPYTENFVAEVETQTGNNKNTEIIVYCASATCTTSVAAGEALDKAGFTNVAHYAEGLAGWQISGLDFESANN